MTQHEFDQFLKRAVSELDSVPPTPRDEMWARIQHRRKFQVVEIEKSSKRKVWAGWGVGLAAMLAVGVGIGRITAPTLRNDTEQVAGTGGAAPATTTAGRSATAYRYAVSEYMSSAEALLTSYRTQPKGTADPELAVMARDLLTNTRLLLDSPAGQDPKVAALLGDLELIIAQIARVQAPSAVEREIIRDGMNKTAVIPRIRATAGT
ncbi:MAG TPA: hypothetical protein VM100_07320 [Longimicrobiales bacterium]|nr:hypothetical protein [Longimicrobiales bacterium]